MTPRPDYDWQDVLAELDKMERRERRFFGAIAVAAILICAAMLLSSCTLTVEPDGRRTYTAEPDAFLYAIEAWAASKAVPVDSRK